jgi:hypothetical protein
MANRFVSAVEKVGVWLEKLFANPKTEQKILGAIKIIAPFLEALLGMAVGGPAEVIVANIVSELSTDYSTVAAVVQEGMPAPGSTGAQTIARALDAIKTNFSTLLADADVKNSAKAAEINATVTGIIQETEAIISLIGTAPAPAA